MKSALALCLLTISAPALAVAQDMSGAVTLGFGDHEISDIDQGLSTATLDGRVNLTFANGMTFGVNAGYLDLGIDGAPVDITATFVGLDLGYKMTSGLSFGVYAEQLTADAGLGIDLSLKSIGAKVGYETGSLDLGAYLGRTSVSPDIAGIEADTFGLSAKYAAMPNLTLGGTFQRATLSVGGGADEADVDLLGIAGAYDINEQFSMFGGISRTSIDQTHRHRARPRASATAPRATRRKSPRLAQRFQPGGLALHPLRLQAGHFGDGQRPKLHPSGIQVRRPGEAVAAGGALDLAPRS
jgi:hypothetical protein